MISLLDDGKMAVLNRNVSLKKNIKIISKGFNNIIDELKQRISTKTLKLKRYKSRVKQYRQNRTFKNNQKALYEKLDEKTRQEQANLKAPRPDGLHGFWLKKITFPRQC